MSKYDGTLKEIDDKVEWLALTNDKSVIPQIKRLLAGLKRDLDAPPSVVPAEEVKPDRLAAARAAKAAKRLAQQEDEPQVEPEEAE